MTDEEKLEALRAMLSEWKYEADVLDRRSAILYRDGMDKTSDGLRSLAFQIRARLVGVLDAIDEDDEDDC